MSDFSFHLDGELVCFEKSDAASGRKRRIAGIISTETRDRQQEIIIQKGLNFEPFMTHGWFNDNHSKDTDGVVGWPEKLQQFRRGETLPNGELAKSNCTWVEGYLMEGDGSSRADRIWSLSSALSKSGSPRRLGYSIEGTVHKRMGPGRKIVAEASVLNCAVTNCPVNGDTKLETLAKSLNVVARLPDEWDQLEAIEKGLTAGAGQLSLPAGPQQGAGAGAVLQTESLETAEDLEERKKKARKLSKSEAFDWVQKRLPGFSTDQVNRFVDAVTEMTRQGRI